MNKLSNTPSTISFETFCQLSRVGQKNLIKSNPGLKASMLKETEKRLFYMQNNTWGADYHEDAFELSQIGPRNYKRKKITGESLYSGLEKYQNLYEFLYFLD